jgi:hypothetical protein
MERRHTDGFEQNVEMILAAGFDGISMSLTDPEYAKRAASLLKPDN